MIVSASYRTDIPASYAPWFLRRLEAGSCRVVNPYGGSSYEVSLTRFSSAGASASRPDLAVLARAHGIAPTLCTQPELLGPEPHGSGKPAASTRHGSPMSRSG